MKMMDGSWEGGMKIAGGHLGAASNFKGFFELSKQMITLTGG